jgi:DNA-binding transcriptional regulator GbsR (MarR family)
MTLSTFTHRMGLLFEQDALPHIAGRVFGLLLVSQEARCLGELAEVLQVSKASVSTNARLLARLGVLERVRRPGDRRDFYQISPDLFARSIGERLERWNRFTQLVGEARRTLQIRSTSVRARLEEYETGFAFMAAAIGRALATWHRTPVPRRRRVASREIRT